MSQKTYHKTDTQVCGDCMGEGEVWKQTDPARHGSSDYEVGTFIKCGLCSGSGMVKVTRDVTITVNPHNPKGKKNG